MIRMAYFTGGVSVASSLTWWIASQIKQNMIANMCPRRQETKALGPKESHSRGYVYRVFRMNCAS